MAEVKATRKTKAKKAPLTLKVFSGELTKADSADAGWDIPSSSGYILAPRTSESINTNLKVGIPKGYVGIVKARSGLSFRSSVEVGAGVIDSGYRGEVKVKLYNNSDKKVVLQRGTRVAQLIVVPVLTCDIEYTDSIDETERGDNGFGSSGN